MSYIDSRGVEMEELSFTQALQRLYDLALENQIDGLDIALGDEGLQGQAEWQAKALETLHDFMANHGDVLESLEPSTQAQDWPDELWRAQREMDPSIPVNAIRICLDLAEQNALDPKDCGRDVDLAEQCDLQQQCFDVVCDLLGMHGGELEKIQVADPTPPRP